MARCRRAHATKLIRVAQKRATTIPSTEHRIPDRVRGDFSPQAPDVTWCGDISYIPTWEGFLYLAFCEDLASRRILGLSMAGHMRAELVCHALAAVAAALNNRPRKTLGWRTPAEALSELLSSAPAGGVATTP